MDIGGTARFATAPIRLCPVRIQRLPIGPVIVLCLPVKWAKNVSLALLIRLMRANATFLNLVVISGSQLRVSIIRWNKLVKETPLKE